MPSEPVILLDDGPLLAVNKPAGWLTQGTAGGLPTLEAWVKDYLKARHGKTGNVYLGIPQRLDRAVSGVIVFARNSKAAARLAEEFREHRVEKEYWALVERRGTDILPASSELHDWLLKDPQAGHVSVVSHDVPHAREARLSYRVLSEAGQFTLLAIHPQSGRTHQIRVQLAHHGWPIVGDVQYGSAVPWQPEEHPPGGAIALHAMRLTLRHPIRYEPVTIEAPPPLEWNL